MSDDKKLPVVSEDEFKKHSGPGRPSTPRKMRQSVKQMLEELGANPIELLAALIKGDYKYFGFEHPTAPRYDKEGNIVGETLNLTPDLRFQGAKTAMDFSFSKNLKLSGDEENPMEFKGKLEVDMRKIVTMIKTAKGE